MKKKILFITATRADFSKLKSLIQILQKNKKFDVKVFVTGMHLIERYGLTTIEVARQKEFKRKNSWNKPCMTPDLRELVTVFGWVITQIDMLNLPLIMAWVR